MPAVVATTAQVYVATLLAGVGPVVVVQLVTPLIPVIAHVPRALGATALAGPLTVALKVMVDPSAALGALALTATVGVALATVVV